MDDVTEVTLAANEIARSWPQEQSSPCRLQREDDSHALMRRQTVAAEASATAARALARWAQISAIISVAALLATAWPHIRLADWLLKLAK